MQRSENRRGRGVVCPPCSIADPRAATTTSELHSCHHCCSTSHHCCSPDTVGAGAACGGAPEAAAARDAACFRTAAGAPPHAAKLPLPLSQTHLLLIGQRTNAIESPLLIGLRTINHGAVRVCRRSLSCDGHRNSVDTHLFRACSSHAEAEGLLPIVRANFGDSSSSASSRMKRCSERAAATATRSSSSSSVAQ